MNERGSLFIAGLWAMCLFSIMSPGLIFGASQQLMLMKRERQDFQAKLEFISGVNQAALAVQNDPEPHQDSSASAWFGDLVSDERLANHFSIYVEDEESRLNLNQATAVFMGVFFKAFEENVGPLKGSRKDYVKEILKLRYEKRIASLEELLLMEGFKAGDYEILRPFLTVYPDLPMVNINTASPLVRNALLESLPGDHGSKQILKTRLEEACRKGCKFSSLDLSPENFSRLLKLPGTPQMIALEQLFLAAVTLDSSTFRIKMKASSGKRAEAVIATRIGKPRPEILWWHEG